MCSRDLAVTEAPAARSGRCPVVGVTSTRHPVPSCALVDTVEFCDDGPIGARVCRVEDAVYGIRRVLGS